MTEFEIERRSCGQSMTNFRFFTCGGQNNFIGCHYYFVCAFYETYNKNGKNVQNQFTWGSALGTALTD